MKHQKIMGAAVATLAAVAFSAAPVASFAEDHAAATTEVKCYGGNACKGQSACKTAKNACKGQNSCKGTGVSMAASEQACSEAGGKTTEG